MKQLSDKTSDQWIDLKGPNSGSGKIHIQHLYFEKTSELAFYFFSEKGLNFFFKLPEILLFDRMNYFDVYKTLTLFL